MTHQEVKIRHSRTKTIWYIVGTQVANKYKIAMIPYDTIGNKGYDSKSRAEAYDNAQICMDALNKAYKENLKQIEPQSLIKS